jgi:hypothetical protein
MTKNHWAGGVDRIIRKATACDLAVSRVVVYSRKGLTQLVDIIGTCRLTSFGVWHSMFSL